MHLSANLEGNAASIDSLHELFAQMWESCPNVSVRDRTLFSIAVAEIAANVIEHVNQSDNSWELDLSVWEDHLEASIRHPGPAVGNALAAWSMPDEMAESGRGLALAAAASSLHYSHSTNPEGSEWRVTHPLKI